MRAATGLSSTGWRLGDGVTRHPVGFLARTRKPNSSLSDKGKRSRVSEGPRPDWVTSRSRVTQSGVWQGSRIEQPQRATNCRSRGLGRRAGECSLPPGTCERFSSGRSPRTRAIAKAYRDKHQASAGWVCASANGLPGIAQAADEVRQRVPLTEHLTERAPPAARSEEPQTPPLDVWSKGIGATSPRSRARVL